MLKLKKITPTFNHILVTRDVYEKDVKEKGVLTYPKGTVKRYQRVIAVGPTVKVCKPGDMIMMDPIRYGKTKHQPGSLHDGVVTDNPIVQFSIPTININDVEYMYLYDQDVMFVMDQFEEVDDPPELYVQPTPDLIC